MRHTPGPLTGQELHNLWVSNSLCYEQDYEWEKRTEVARANWERLAEAINKRLIAAAPDLLAEPQRLLAATDALHEAAHRAFPVDQWYERECLLRDLQQQKLDADVALRAAIAKATGSGSTGEGA